MPNFDRPMSALTAMRLSEREDRIVHLRWSPQLAADLLADSDGTADHPHGVYEFWADDLDSDEDMKWRVHLHKDH